MRILADRLKKLTISMALILVILFIIYITTTYLFAYIAPFIIAIVISCINEPIISFMENKMKINRKLSSVISLTLTVSIIAVLITLGVFKMYYELMKLKVNLPQYMESISSTVADCYNRASVFYYNLPENISGTFQYNLKSILPQLEGVIGQIAASILSSITSVPKVAVFTTVTLLSSYFISSDRRNIIGFINRQFPGSFKKDLRGVKSDTLSAIVGYFKAQLILMTITFVQTTIGLIVIRADYAVLMGFLVALADGIPILGTTIVMFPWIAWNVITGNMQMAFGLAAVYLIGVIIRQIIEPKIVSNQTGLHPFATLISMYFGLMLFGFLGIFIGPIFVIFLKSLQKSGLINIWND